MIYLGDLVKEQGDFAAAWDFLTTAEQLTGSGSSRRARTVHAHALLRQATLIDTQQLPVDRRQEADLRNIDLAPFKALIDDGIESLMMAHVRYTAIDQQPASLSSRWIADILRGELGVSNAIFCDDLSMNGAAVVGDMQARARLALAAGCDMLPVCNDRAAAITLIDALKDITPSRKGSARLKKLYGRPTGATA